MIAGRVLCTLEGTGEVFDLGVASEIRFEPEQSEVPGEIVLASRHRLAEIKVRISSRTWHGLTGGAYRFKRSAKPARKRARR